jgi:hypothetical protein
MAAFREHVRFSSMLGIGYGVASSLWLGFTPVQGALAGGLTAFGGMLPDLDSARGRPAQEIFPLVGAVAPLFLIGPLLQWAGIPSAPDTVMLALIGMYIAIRYGGPWFVDKLSVHRGMFHSLPAMIIAGEVIFLGYPIQENPIRLLMAAGVAIGFFSHLLLDEIYSVQVDGVRVRLKKSWGTAIKWVGPNFLANAVAFSLAGVLTYASLTSAGWIKPEPLQAEQQDAGTSDDLRIETAVESGEPVVR